MIYLLEDAFFSAVATLGFAILFSVPKRFLISCMLASALGHSFRTYLIDNAVAIEWASFAAAVLVGTIVTLMAKRHKAPQILYGVAAVIPMVPGTYAFATVKAVVALTATSTVSGELTQAVVSSGLKTTFILGALGVGLALPTLLFYRNRPLVR